MRQTACLVIKMTQVVAILASFYLIPFEIGTENTRKVFKIVVFRCAIWCQLAKLNVNDNGFLRI